MDKLEFILLAKGWLDIFKKRLMLFTMLFLIPVSMSFLLGYAMEAKQVKNIPTIIIDRDNSAISRSITEEIRSNEIFSIVKYSQNDSDVKEYLDHGKAAVAVVIPESFNKDLLAGKGPNVLVMYDASQMSVASAAKSRMTEILLTVKTGYLMQVMEGKLNVLPGQAIKAAQPMYFTYRFLNNPTRNYVNFLLPGMLIVIIQVGLVMIGADRVNWEDEKLRFCILKALCWGVLGSLSIAVTLWVQCRFFDMPFKGSLTGGIMLTLLFSTAIISFGMLVMQIIPDKLLATQASAICMLPASILGGYTYPLSAMPLFFQKLGYIMPYTHYSESMRDLIVQDIGIKYVMGDILWLLKFITIVWIGLAVMILGKRLIKELWYKYKGGGTGIAPVIDKDRFMAIFNLVKNVFILIPLIIAFTFIFGNVYSKTFVQQIPMVVVDHDNSVTSRSIIRQFNDSEGMKVERYADSDSEAQELIRTKKVSAGLIIPKNFEDDVKKGRAPNTLYLVDMTNLVIGNNAFAYGSEILNTMNAAVQIQVLEGKGMTAYESEKAVTSMNFVQRMIYDPQMSYLKYLMYGIMGVMIQQTILEVLVPMLIQEKQKLMDLELKTRERRRCVRGIAKKTLFVICCSIVGATLCFYFICKYFDLPLRGTLMNNYILLIIFMVNLIGIGFFLAGLFRQALPGVQLCMFLSVPTILTSGYAWPELMLPPGFMNKVNLVWPLGCFINPLRTINLKATGIAGILPYLKGSLTYAAIWVPLGIGFYVLKIYMDKSVKKKINELKEQAAMEQIQNQNNL